MQAIYKPVIILLFLVTAIQVVAQKQSFDLASFTPPNTWERQVTENYIQFTKSDSVKDIYCAILLLKSVPGTTDSKDNFNAAWETIVKEMVDVSGPPEMHPVAEDNGWEMQSGYAAFVKEENKGVVMLVTATGAQKMMNLVILTNTDIYEKNISDFIASVRLKKQEVTTPQGPVASTGPSVVGLWGISATTASYYNMSTNEGNIITQYKFNANGTYSFTIKTFKYLLTNILLTRETGTYKTSGNIITITPLKSVTEAWTKNNGDHWGKLVSSQKRQLEKATYQFSVENYVTGSSLLLKASPTKRDGAYNNYDKDAWVYPAKTEAELIKLPEGSR